MTHITRLFGAAILGITMLTAGTASAQSQGDQSVQTQSASQLAQDFSQQQLQRFVGASAQVRDIRQSARQQMQQAEDRNARTQIRKQARQDMLAAIKNSGLTLQEYNQIARAAQANSRLAQKIKQMQ